MERSAPKARMGHGELFGLVLAFAILAAVAALAYASTDAAEDTLAWVEHTRQVLREIEEGSALYSRAVSARRVYIVGRRRVAPRRGPAARRGRRSCDRRLARIDRRQSDPGSAARLPGGAEFRLRRVAIDASVARRRREGGGGEPADGLALDERIRAGWGELEAEENGLLADRDSRTHHELAGTKVAEIVGTLGSFGILSFVFGRLRQEIARRQRSTRALHATEGFSRRPRRATANPRVRFEPARCGFAVSRSPA